MIRLISTWKLFLCHFTSWALEEPVHANQNRDVSKNAPTGFYNVLQLLCYSSNVVEFLWGTVVGISHKIVQDAPQEFMGRVVCSLRWCLFWTSLYGTSRKRSRTPQRYIEGLVLWTADALFCANVALLVFGLDVAGEWLTRQDPTHRLDLAGYAVSPLALSTGYQPAVRCSDTSRTRFINAEPGNVRRDIRTTPCLGPSRLSKVNSPPLAPCYNNSANHKRTRNALSNGKGHEDQILIVANKYSVKMHYVPPTSIVWSLVSVYCTVHSSQRACTVTLQHCTEPIGIQCALVTRNKWEK